MSNLGNELGKMALGQNVRGSREDSSIKCNWKKEGKAGYEEFCLKFYIYPRVRWVRNYIGVRRGAYKLEKEPHLRFISGGWLRIEGYWYYYTVLVKYEGGREIVVCVLLEVQIFFCGAW